jgi:phosphoribosylformylglycinamidine synthase
MAEACRALDFPVVSGNVSLYNETKNEDGSNLTILPTPAIGGVGLLDDWEKSATIGFKAEGLVLYVIGGPTPHFYDRVREPHGYVPSTHDPAIPNGHLGQSMWLSILHGRLDGPPPTVDLEKERRTGEFLRDHIASGVIRACHDVSDGGILASVAEMALASGIGAKILFDDPAHVEQVAFGEDQGRYIVAVDLDPSGYREGVGFHTVALTAGVDCWAIGVTGGDSLQIDVAGGGREGAVSLADLRAAHEGFFPKLMGSELPPEF